MAQTSGRIFDEISRLMTDAAGVAQGVKREVDGVVRGQAEKILRDLDIPSREEFEAARGMAEKARAEADAHLAQLGALQARVEALETRLSAIESAKAAPKRAPKADPEA